MNSFFSISGEPGTVDWLYVQLGAEFPASRSEDYLRESHHYRRTDVTAARFIAGPTLSPLVLRVGRSWWLLPRWTRKQPETVLQKLLALGLRVVP